MHDNGPRSFFIAMSTTAPLDAATTTLFNSVDALGARQLRHVPFARLSLAVENSHAGTIEASFSNDGGANWDVYDSRAVTAAGAGVISGPYDYLIDTYDDFRLRWINGGTTQTTWRPVMRGHENRQPGT